MSDENDSEPPLQTSNAEPSLAISSVTWPSERSLPEQPRMLGGFVLDDDEDEEEEYAPEMINIHENDLTNATNVVDVVQNAANGQHLESVSASNDNLSPESVSSVSETKKNHTGMAESASHSSHVPTAMPVVAGSTPVAQPPSLFSHDVQISASVISMTDTSANMPKTRLPHDYAGFLEDRIKDDPRGDTDAWLSLIAEYRKRNKLVEAREVYERFFKVFPHAAEQWVTYADMELEHNDFYRVEQIFSRTLLAVPNVHLWSTYLNYVRRRNNILNDKTGSARKIVTETYEFVLSSIGQDKDSGDIWQDYVQFIRNSPEQIGGTTWQDQQKMDMLRKIYQRAICVPTQAVHALWKEYDVFENSINKQTGRKFLQEKSPSYMTARSANTALQTLTKDLQRTTLPSMPPALGFEGDLEYFRQLEIWKQWIDWEKDDPLVLKEEDAPSYKARVVYTYRQAMMTLRFWPELWYEAAEFCFHNGLDQDGNDFLTQGIAANPESCLLAFKRADRIETIGLKDDAQDDVVQRGVTVREPYDKVLDALYELCNKVKERETSAIARLRTTAFKKDTVQTEGPIESEEGEGAHAGALTSSNVLETQIDAVQRGYAAQFKILSQTISFTWIALMRAMRRIQGKGKPGEAIGGSRQIFADSRKRGRLTSDVYIANALIEFHCYQDPVATKVFDRGLKLFPEDDRIALEYIKHLIAVNDTTNARVVFETTVTRIAQNAAQVNKCKPLYQFFHEFESRYGEVGQITKLESRMRDLFPDDPQLRLFAQRFANEEFDPTAIRLIISPKTQAQPKSIVPLQSELPLAGGVGVPAHANFVPQITLSPKRPLDDAEAEALQPRKIPRAESPLKGAAGRRLDAQKKSQLRQEFQSNGNHNVTAANNAHINPASLPLPPDLYNLLTILPRAEFYNATPFNAQKMIDLLRSIDVSMAISGRPSPGLTNLGTTLPSQFS